MKMIDHKKHKVLVVDDDADISTMLKLMLEYNGYHVGVFQRTGEIISAIAGNNISLVIIDMFLSGASGIDYCKQVKQEQTTAGCLVLMISAHPNAKELCLQSGADDFIAKPFDMQDMLSKISQLINKSLTINSFRS